MSQGGEDIPINVQRFLSGQLKDVWTLNWVLAVYLNRGYYIYPISSQIQNIGCDGTGMHCNTTRQFDNFCMDKKVERLPEDIFLNEGLIDNYNGFFGKPNKRNKRSVSWTRVYS